MKWLLRTLPALLHVIASLQYIRFMVLADENSLGSVLMYGFIIVTAITASVTMLVSKGQWRQFLISSVAYIVWFIVWMVGLQLIINLHVVNAPEDDPALGMLILFVGLPLSLISLVFGTITGIMLVQLRTQIRLFRQ